MFAEWGQSRAKEGKESTAADSTNYKKKMEARGGSEPTHKGFADLSLTTWVPRPLPEQKPSTLSHCTGNCLGASTSGHLGKVRAKNLADFVGNSSITPPIA